MDLNPCFLRKYKRKIKLSQLYSDLNRFKTKQFFLVVYILLLYQQVPDRIVAALQLMSVLEVPIGIALCRAGY